MREALAGSRNRRYGWSIVAMFIARAALFFIRTFGQRSLGLAYAVQMTDVTLASAVPSITARSAGMVLPVPVSIAELMGSRPGPTASRLGTFLIAAMYPSSAVACAMFLTGQASNVPGANLALKLVNLQGGLEQRVCRWRRCRGCLLRGRARGGLSC